MPTTDEIFGKVQETLVDALGVDEDEVTAGATLVGDLGAESIDFLDIVFRLEKNFSVKIPRGELFPENLAAADASFVQDGVITKSGIAELRSKLPHANVDKFVTVHGQELSPTNYAICQADLLIKNDQQAKVTLGNSLIPHNTTSKEAGDQ